MSFYLQASNTSCYPMQYIIRSYIIVFLHYICQTCRFNGLFKNKRIAFGQSRPDRSRRSQSVTKTGWLFSFLVFVIKTSFQLKTPPKNQFLGVFLLSALYQPLCTLNPLHNVQTSLFCWRSNTCELLRYCNKGIFSRH